MTAKLEAKPKERKEDLINLLVLISIAAIIGIYLIITTVMLSKDGVFYIELAQQFVHDPIEIIKDHLPGHPFLILLAHKFVSLFTNSTSNQMWIYSAQSVTLLCKLLALIPLYLIGKILVGSKNSFWGVLILSILPDSAKYGSDALAEWPHYHSQAITVCEDARETSRACPHWGVLCHRHPLRKDRHTRNMYAGINQEEISYGTRIFLVLGHSL